MKTRLFNIVILLIALTSFAPVYSQDQKKESRQEPKFKKQKSYTKSYNVSSGDRISLENQFGEMKLITWDRNEVKVDVAITGSSDEESRAQQILDRISIQDEKTGGGVSFKTRLADNDDWNKEKRNRDRNYNEGMSINYTVYLPSGNSLTAKNQFGAMIVPDYRGEVNLESQFGSLTTGKLTNAKNIKVAFGKADIGQVNNGRLEIQYSSGTVNKLVGDIDAKIQFCGPIKLKVDNDIKSLDIDNSYSTLYLDLSKNLSASYNISTSYGSFKNQSNFKIDGDDDREERGFTSGRKYSGSSGGGGNRINVKSSFGSVIAGHDLQVNTSGKKKSATI